MILRRCEQCVDHAETIFRIDDMCCAHEVALIERRLGKLVGVAAFDADVLGRRLKVHFDAATIDQGRIAQAVAETGMRAWPVDVASRTADAARQSTFPRLLAAAVGALLLATGVWALDGAPKLEDALLLAAIALAMPGTLTRAVKAVRGRRLDIHVLMMVAVLGALAIDEWFEAAAVVVLFGTAQWLETRSLERARRAVREVFAFVPEMAEVRGVGGSTVMSVRDVLPGTELLVRAGSRVPLDGVVVTGASTVDQSAITGESVPIACAEGDAVYGGSINGDGALVMRTTRGHDDSTVARILHMVEEAQSRRAHLQSLVDRFAAVYTPVVLVLAVLAAAVPPLLWGVTWTAALHTSLVLLVVSCPCALVIATPVAVVSALSGAARRGLLLKGGSVLERLATVRGIAFDKTGTLSEGALEVVSVETAAEVPADTVLRLAAALEAQVSHPVAAAVVRHVQHLGIDLPDATAVVVTPGGGVEGIVHGQRVTVGSLRWLASRDGVGLPPADASVLSLGLMVDGQFAGGLRLRDRPRPEAGRVIARLRELVHGRVWLLSGDGEVPVAALARDLGIDQWRAALLPHEKVGVVEALQQTEGRLLMVGDGINDGPALATAHVGLAMGGGTDVALEAADGALMQPNLSLIPYALALGRRTVSTIRFNVAFAVSLKLVVVVLAAMQLASLWLAVAADVGASLIVVAVSLRLLRFAIADMDAT